MKRKWFVLAAVCLGMGFPEGMAALAQEKGKTAHPCIVTTPGGKAATLKLVEQEEWARKVVDAMKANVDRYADKEEDYLSSRLYMNWKTQARDVYIRGEVFSHVGE